MMSCRTARLSAGSPHCEALRWGILKWPQAGEFGWPPGLTVSSLVGSDRITTGIEGPWPKLGLPDIWNVTLRSLCRQAQQAIALLCALR